LYSAGYPRTPRFSREIRRQSTGTFGTEIKGTPTWGLDGKYVFSSSGDIIDAATKRVVAQLKDETGTFVEGDKMLEVLFSKGKPIRTVNQFGVGLAHHVDAVLP
jgi:hypothetical protein